MGLEDVSVGEVEPGEQDQCVADADPMQRVGEDGIDLEHGFGGAAPSNAWFRASAGALSLERTTPIGRKVCGYTAPGSADTVLNDEPFYTEEVNGQRFVDWVTRLIERKPVDDVNCRECRVG